VPWHIKGQPVGTLWLLSHDREHRFDAEDARIVQSLSRFASAAHQMVLALKQVEAANEMLERRVEERTSALSLANDALQKEMQERIQAELALRETEKLAVVGRLASSIAHEINNPLAAVTNLLFLAGSSEASPEVHQYLAQAREELERACRITTDTLRFHRQNSKWVPTDVSELIESVISLHQARLRDVQVTLEKRYSMQRHLVCHPGEIRQVVANLITNAVDAMRDGTSRNLFLRVREARDWLTDRLGVRITVADTGHGMDTETRKRIFEPFFTTKESDGTGLGLWVTDEIIRRHQGKLQVRSSRSTNRTGSVFSLFLPHRETA
jgi:signal transduction histidine kinase